MWIMIWRFWLYNALTAHGKIRFETPICIILSIYPKFRLYAMMNAVKFMTDNILTD